MSHYIYRIYYDKEIVYVGRTSQELRQRLRGHFFSRPLMRKIDLSRTTLVEASELPSEADLFVYEVFYINSLKPSLNRDDKAKDDLTVKLPELQWKTIELPLRDKWLQLLYDRNILHDNNLELKEQLFTKERNLKDLIRTGQLSEEVGYELLNEVRIKIKAVNREINLH